MPSQDYPLEPQLLTKGPGNHTGGYFNVSPWDATGRYVLALEADFFQRAPGPDDAARIMLVDTHSGGAMRQLATTRAWNWQMGCMLQWLGGEEDRTIIHNDVRDGKAVAVVRNVFTGEERVLPRPVYAVSRSGKQALSCDFGRLHWARPGYGYACVEDPNRHEAAPEDDGIFWMDVQTGENRLILSLRQLAELHPLPSMRGAVHKVNHLEFNDDDTCFSFFHRWQIIRGPARMFAYRCWQKVLRTFLGHPVRRVRITRMLVARPDGSEMKILADDGMVSHYDWRDSDHVMGWANVQGRGEHYYIYDRRTGEAKEVGADVLECDGHCTYSPDRKWIITDTYSYPPDFARTLILYRVGDGMRFNLGRFKSNPEWWDQFRCDLHPRWNRDGTKVCFDSIHEGSRQMYCVDISPLLREAAPGAGQAVPC